MGWTFCRRWHSKQVLVEKLISYEGEITYFTIKEKFTCRTVDYAVVGNTLYRAIQLTGKDTGQIRFILEIYLMQGGREGWGYKDLCEDMGPYRVDCPLRLLDRVPCPDSDHARAWRKSVREYHAKKDNQARKLRDIRSQLAIGRILVAPGCRPERVSICHLAPLIGISSAGQRYRITPRVLRRAYIEEEDVNLPTAA